MIDLGAIEDEFLVQCGPCDYGLSGGCACPRRDYRSTMLALVREVERLREVLRESQNEFARIQGPGGETS